MRRYQYLVAYSFQGGVGRTFVTCTEPIDSDDRVESVERSIRVSNGIETVAMMNFQLLRCYDDDAGALQAAQEGGA